jgi:serine/threonine protein kinase/tetratricopeptide (TPR) repeat protein
MRSALVDSAELQARLETALAGDFTLERELGRGGMATVYLAHDRKHDRPVALKVVHQEIAQSLGRERFTREIRLAAKLQHPHILSVYDSGETASGQLWFTMPYVEGESLRDRLVREHQLPIEDALGIARQVARALDCAHRHGVVHRDVKPENILLTDGQALVADFGIARALEGDEAGITHGLTATGMAVGTPRYMSPEQVSGERTIDARTDVYSLGTVLYEMLAGEPPFTGATTQTIVAKMMSGEPPSVRRARPTVPAAVDAALRTALAPAPADRYASAAAFAAALDAAERTTRGPAETSTRRVRRPSLVASALTLGFLAGLGMLFAWRSHESGSAASGAATLAVLPFENLGDSADAYFADGVTDAVRDKLAGLPGLQVIARASSAQYQHATKGPQEIGRELGVKYLLTGTVRWAKGPGGASRVQVRPELIDAASAAEKWGEPFDAALTDVFQVQADVAGKVAHALGVALNAGDQQIIAERPTTNLEAYDAYLRGEAIEAKAPNDPATLRRAAQSYARAVALDSSFALAWAALGNTHAMIYFDGAPTAADSAASQQAAERALVLAPQLPEAHAAMGSHDGYVRRDYARALGEYEAALRRAPHSAILLSGAARAERALGRWDAAVAHYREASRLDPRSVTIAQELGRTSLWLRRLSEARSSLDRALAISPGNLSAVDFGTMVSLAEGDLDAARAVARAARTDADPGTLDAYLATYYDLDWALDSAGQRALEGLTAAAFDGNGAEWGLARAQSYWHRGDLPRARAYADSARVAYEAQLKETPEDDQLHAFHGLALAYLGRKAEAIQEGERAVALRPIARDAFNGPYVQHQLVRIYIAAGEPEKALDILEPLLKIPYYLTPGWLRIDPNFAPLRGNPRFQRLVAGS